MPSIVHVLAPLPNPKERDRERVNRCRSRTGGWEPDSCFPHRIPRTPTADLYGGFLWDVSAKEREREGERASERERKRERERVGRRERTRGRRRA